jgi:hypothetical protein
MKNLLSLLTAMLLISYAFASDVTFLLTTDKYDVYLDGRKLSNYQSRNNQVKMNNLSTGRHRLEVYKDKDDDNDKYDRNRSNKKWNQNSRNNRKDKLIYSSYLDVKGQSDYFIAIEKDGKVNIDERSRYNNRNNRDRQDNERSSRHRGNDNYGNGGYDRNDGYNNGRYDKNGGYNNGSYGNNLHKAISNYEFDKVLQGIRNAWLGKFSKARNEINANYFYTEQVRQLLQIFNSENDRMELAKMSYPKIVDQSRFRDIYSLFSNSGQRELDDFLRTSRY